MPAPSDRERLLKLIDSSSRPAEGGVALSESPARPVPAGDPAAPVAPRQVAFDLRQRAAEVYDRVRAAVAAPAGDRRYPLVTASLILVTLFTVLAGVDRWRTWSSTREVAVLGDQEAQALRQALGLKLVGVDWSAVPVALVEDLATGKTHFVRQGDSIHGARVQLIFKDKVIFQTAKGRIALR